MSDKVKVEIEQFCSEFLGKEIGEENSGDNTSKNIYIDYVKAFGQLKALLKLTDLEIPLPKLKPESRADNMNEITSFINSCFIEVADAPYKSHFEEKFGNNLIYEFSDDDYARVQELLNKLRDVIQKSKEFDDDFRYRILKKLEKLQSEFNKKMWDLSGFWGWFGKLGISLGKFGKDAEPVLKYSKEILEIVSRTEAKAEGVKGRIPLSFDNNKLENNS